MVAGKRLVASTSVPVTAYLKTACTPGFYGSQCSMECYECPGDATCNPVTGLCDNLVTCITDLQLTGCRKAISLECPQETGWWFWDGHCYFISERRQIKSWPEAKSACTSYRDTWLLTINSLEEKEWVSSMIQSPSWTGLSTTSRGLVWTLADGQKPNVSASWFSITPLGSIMNTFCVTLSSTPSALVSKACETLSGWVCEQPVISTFERHPMMLLLHPLPQNPQGHLVLAAAVASCLAHLSQCTGITVRHGLHYAVTGTELVQSMLPTDMVYIRSACFLGFFGPRCAQRCPICFQDMICNPVLGECQGAHTCVSNSPGLTPCPYALTSVLCPSDLWRLWKGRCYYVETTTSRPGKEASIFCDRFRATKLLHIRNTEEKNWIVSTIQHITKGSVDRSTTYWLLGSESVTAERCPVLTAGGEESSKGCRTPSFFICQGVQGLLAHCPADPRWHHWRGSCYFHDPTVSVTWSDAMLICNSYKDTELLYITSLEEQDAVSMIFNGLFWTGLNDRKVESVFVWTSGEPVNKEVAESLKQDMADGGLKDCVLINTRYKMLTDNICSERQPFICKCSEATEWYEEAPDQGILGDLSSMFPVEGDLGKAKEMCNYRQSLCFGIIQAGKWFYLVTSSFSIVSDTGTTAYTRMVCSIGISGKQCIVPKNPKGAPRCDCSGSISTSISVVCNVPVMDCVSLCLQQKLANDCNKCVPLCPVAGARELDGEEVALVSILEHKAEQFLILSTDTDVEPQNISRNILYSIRDP